MLRQEPTACFDVGAAPGGVRREVNDRCRLYARWSAAGAAGRPAARRGAPAGGRRVAVLSGWRRVPGCCWCWNVAVWGIVVLIW